ncbi:MAG: DUF6443 domain-containing protein, partial [Bacteroidales bacterium]|nr:DUF6443 domain-containing protein [Bacteroidales bacterium]
MKTLSLLYIRRAVIAFALIFRMSVAADGQEKETYLKDLQHTMSRMTGVGCDTAEMNRMLLMMKEYRNTGATVRGTEKTAVQAKSMAMAGENAVRSSVAAGNLHHIPVTFHLYVSPEGNDNNAGTAAAPFRTIQKAVNTASEGQAVQVGDGVYAESVTVTKSIHIVGNVEYPQSVVIEATGASAVSISNASPSLHGLCITKGVKGLNLHNAYAYFSHLILKQNTGQAIYSSGRFFCSVYNSLIYGNHCDKVIELADATISSMAFENVTVTDNFGDYTCYLSGSDLYLSFLSCILYNPDVTAEIPPVYPLRFVSCYYSLVRGFGQYLYTSSSYDLLDRDPRFGDSFNECYSLASGSPCIDAGDYVPGERIPPGKGSSDWRDMGAYGNQSYLAACMVEVPDIPDTPGEALGDLSVNYVQTFRPLYPVTAISDPGTDKNMTTIEYYDGLGRPMQTIAMGASPSGGDMITPFSYDGYDRRDEEYLPYASDTATGEYRRRGISEQDDFYASLFGGYQKAFSKTIYEPSPRSRVLEQYGPGAAWQNHSKRAVMQYRANEENEALLWAIASPGATANGCYAARALYVTETADEDGRITVEYTDKQGRVVRQKQKTDSNTWAVTDYCYDHYGRKAFVMPPKIHENNITSFTSSSAAFLQYIYAYRYDTRGREVEKHVPGAGWTYTVYNKLDQPVLMQGAEQRTRNEWSFTKYDAHGRITVTGLYTSTASRETLQGNVYAAAQWEDRGTAAHGYTNSAFPADA